MLYSRHSAPFDGDPINTCHSHVIHPYLRVDVRVPDALVQQLPHGALEARADLLRLVRHVQVRHPQLPRRVFMYVFGQNTKKPEGALRVGGKTQASGRLAWTTKFSTRFRGSQNSSGVWYLSYSTEITPLVLELGNFCCPLLWRTAKAKWHGTERTRIEVSRDTKREKRNGNTKGQQPGDRKMLLLDCTAAPKPKVDGEQQPVSTTRDGRKQG